jgi:acyl-CoA thioesterase
MFGGVGMGAAIAALERTCGRPVIWATAQYLSYARPPSVVDLDVRIGAEGKHMTQARVSAHLGDTEILTVNAALGSRPKGERLQWARPPSSPPPGTCQESTRWRSDVADLHSQIEVRIAHGVHGRDPVSGPSADGRLTLWIRPRGGQVVDAAMLAIMADHVPSAIGPALGRDAGGNSLDNTIRFMEIVPTAWVLCDIMIVGIDRGIAHGDMRLYAEDGRLLATASQSLIVRLRDKAEAGAAAQADQ